VIPDVAEIVVWHWVGFGVLVTFLLAMDLFVFHRDDHTPSLRESAGWTLFWCSLAVAFNGLIWWWLGSEPGLAFLAGYVVEWSLSMDNVFVFAVIFRFFHVPRQYQYRVLFWGILGAIVLRLLFVLAGTQLIRHFDWVMPIFGVLLVYTAIKLTVSTGEDVHPEKSLVLRIARKLLPVSKGHSQQHGHAFFVREEGKFCITPLFLVLLVVESTDVMFAVDSVPAIFGITLDPFIVFTSNIFAILGLRALYFLLAGVMEMFCYLHFGLAAVLAFVGGGMIADYWFAGHGEHLIPTWAKLVVIAACLAISIVASILAKKKHEPEPEPESQEEDIPTET
jgi:tellurite resistance protein TerC